MDRLSLEVLGRIASFMDAEALTTSASLSRLFYEAVDHDAYWKQAALVLYPLSSQTRAESLYMYDWRAMIRDQNQKDTSMIVDYEFPWEGESSRIYTPWKIFPYGRQRKKIRMIIDPLGNNNVYQPEGPCLSVYLEVWDLKVHDEDEEDPVTLSFKFTLQRDPKKGNPRSWSCNYHHFSLSCHNWGVHNLIFRSAITPESGFVTPDNKIHLRLYLSVVRVRLRIVETGTIMKRQGKGLVDLDSEGHRIEVMGGEILRTIRQKYFPQQATLFFWVCLHREGEGIVPIRRIRSDEERLSMMALEEYQNERGEVILWADRFEDSEHPYFLKRLVLSDVSVPRVVWEGRVSQEALLQESSDTGKNLVLVGEKDLQELEPASLSSSSDNTTETRVVLLVERERLETVHKIYRSYNDQAFQRMEELLDKRSRCCRWVSMEEILCVGSRVYTDWRIRRLLQQHHVNKTMLLRDLLRRPHLGYACDRCGGYNFTGPRYKCAVCSDYDLCEKCHLLPLLPHRYIFRCNPERKDINIKIPSEEHQPSHPLYKIFV